MSTHGILLGALAGTWLFCRRHRIRFLVIVDELVIPAAYIMGLGRIGNFIDGQIVGRVSDMWWAVQFPDVDGFRHPVVLYDGVKNLMLIPLLLLIRHYRPARGVLVAHFMLWYGFLRVFVDIFREYRTDFFGFPPGQEFNILMTVAGVGLLIWFWRRGRTRREESLQEQIAAHPAYPKRTIWVMRIVFVLLLLFPLVIPSDWTQDVPGRYGHRHEGIEHSVLYPRIEASE
jgi:phosphatidylglycerol:prolipoprotein diacylglycerol transferase